MKNVCSELESLSNKSLVFRASYAVYLIFLLGFLLFSNQSTQSPNWNTFSASWSYIEIAKLFKYKKRIFADPILVNKGAMRAAEVIKIGISISFELENWERENKLLNNDPQHLQYYQGSCQQLHAWSPKEWDFLSPSIPDIHAEIHEFSDMESDIITITIQLETKKKNNIVL